MATHPQIASDFIGLIRRAYLSRRRFMTASAAAAAGYTLAAGPVRANPITTGSSGLDTGTAKIDTADGVMPAYYAKPAGAHNPPIILVAMEVFGLHEYIKDVTPAARQARRFCCCSGLLLQARRPDEDQRHQRPDAARQFEA